MAPNIYFLGYAGVVQFGGLRIAGLSGIYKAQHYTMGHFERPPYTESTMRSAYHVRAVDVNRLLRLSGSHIDIFLSHDWPAGIARHGDINALLRKKSFLRREIDDGSLGSPPAAQILEQIKPNYWFSAHLHTKFAALVHHQGNTNNGTASLGDGRRIHPNVPSSNDPTKPSDPSSSAIDTSKSNKNEDEAPIKNNSAPVQSTTRFLSLDKCLPGRQFLQIIDFPEATGPKVLSYDAEWLSILKTTHNLTSLHPRPPPPPPPESVTEAQITEIQAVLAAMSGTSGDSGQIPLDFQPTAPAYSVQEDGHRSGRMPQRAVRNPQTVALFQLLGLDYNLDHGNAGGGMMGGGIGAGAGGVPAVLNPEEIDLDLNSDEDEGEDGGRASEMEMIENPEEIELGDDEDEDEDEQGGRESGGIDPALAAVLNPQK